MSWRSVLIWIGKKALELAAEKAAEKKRTRKQYIP